MRFVFKIGYKVARFIWTIIRPSTVGVRVILIRENQVLLVKHTYQDNWYLPGGGLKKGETFEQAIKREAFEEIGAKLLNLSLFGAYNNFFEKKNDSIIIFVSNEFNISGKTDNEIEQFAFFDINGLPEKASIGTKKRIKEYIEGKSPYYGMW